MASNRGFTLPELALLLLLLGVALRLAIGPAIHQADSLILRGAREELISLFHRARMEARLHGNAHLLISESTDPVLLPAGGAPPIRLFLRGRGVEVDLLGSRTELDLAFGALGIANFASASIRLRRRKALLPLTISGYGRVRR
jgi:hypothetical protein